VAKIVTAVCGLVELAVSTLFGFPFIYRQRETSETMLMLGTGRARVCKYFLYSSGLISLVATATGAAAAYWLHDRIIALVARPAGHFALIDSRFSNGNLTISRTLEFTPQLDWRLFLCVGVAVFVLAVLACLAFTASTFLHSQPSQKRQASPRKEHSMEFERTQWLVVESGLMPVRVFDTPAGHYTSAGHLPLPAGL